MTATTTREIETMSRTGWIRRTLTSTEGPIVADLLPLPFSPDGPLVDVVYWPAGWSRVQAHRAMRAAVADGRIRL